MYHGIVLIRLAGLSPAIKAEIVAAAIEDRAGELFRSFTAIMPEWCENPAEGFLRLMGWWSNCFIAAIFSDPVFGFHVEEVWGRAASYWGSGGWRVWMWIAWMQGHVLM